MALQRPGHGEKRRDETRRVAKRCEGKGKMEREGSDNNREIESNFTYAPLIACSFAPIIWCLSRSDECATHVCNVRCAEAVLCEDVTRQTALLWILLASGRIGPDRAETA